MLATKHFRCNKKRYRTTIFSLFLSIVLFISASSFTMYLVEAAEQEYDANGCDIAFTCNIDKDSGRTVDEMYAAVRSTEGVTDAAYAFCVSYDIEFESRYLTEKAVERYGTDGNGHTKVSSLIICVNDEEYKKLLRKYDLSESEYMNVNAPLAIAADRSNIWDSLNDKYIKMDVLADDDAEGTITHTLRDEEDENVSDGVSATAAQAAIPVKVGRTISDPPYYGYSGGAVPLVVIYPYSIVGTLMPDPDLLSFHTFFILSSDYKATSDAIEEMLISSGNGSYDIEVYAAEIEAVRNIVIIVKVFSFGFIILISLIAAANVFNTITTNVNLRRREFAMLRSVGMSARGLNRMMNFECLMYGAKALLYGLPVSFVVTYLIYMAEKNAFNIVYHLPVWAVATAVFSVFAVVFSAMLYSMHKIKKDNPIDALKNENT